MDAVERGYDRSPPLIRVDLSLSAVDPSPGCLQKRAFTLPEVFITLAVLTGILGLMMNLSNSLRRKSTDEFARATIRRLTDDMDQFQRAHPDQPVNVPGLIEPGLKLDESTLLVHATANNAAVVRLLGLKADRGTYAGLTGGVLYDPWGTPYVFMKNQNQAIGLAPQDRSFFFSAGADRKFLTKDDNLYGYE